MDRRSDGSPSTKGGEFGFFKVVGQVSNVQDGVANVVGVFVSVFLFLFLLFGVALLRLFEHVASELLLVLVQFIIVTVVVLIAAIPLRIYSRRTPPYHCHSVTETVSERACSIEKNEPILFHEFHLPWRASSFFFRARSAFSILDILNWFVSACSE